jgi:dTDP-4-dehydrorhamnose reductase
MSALACAAPGPRSLVVGGDSAIGGALSASMRSRGSSVVATSRRSAEAGSGRLHLDLERPHAWCLPGAIGSAFLCAGRSSFLECERDPAGTRNVNVTATHRLGVALMEAGAFVVLLSTSAVFPGSDPWPDEETPVAPTTAYGAQKAEVERLLLESRWGAGRLAIVRLTKVMLPNSPIVQRFASMMTKAEPVDAFSDLFIAPTSIDFVIEALCMIAARRRAGIYHLSGDLEVSYAEFARRLARNLNAEAAVTPTSCKGNAQVLYRPEHPGLGMRETAARLGLGPESFAVMLNRVVSGLGNGCG